MTQKSEKIEKDGKIVVYLFHDPEADTHPGETPEEPKPESRSMEFHSHLKALLQKKKYESDLSMIDVVISSRARHAYELAQMLSDKSQSTNDTAAVLRHVEDSLEISGITLNHEYQSVLTIEDIGNTIDQLAETIESIPTGAKLLVVLSKENLKSLVRKLTSNSKIDPSLSFGQGVRLTLGENDKITKIH